MYQGKETQKKKTAAVAQKIDSTVGEMKKHKKVYEQINVESQKKR